MPPDPPPRDAIEALVFECLEQEDPRSELERICAAQPEVADALRQHFAMLEGMGMLHDFSRSPAAAPGKGSRFGAFTLLEELGRGGMGVVYLAEQPAMHRQVALKVIRQDYLRNPRSQQRFRREIEAVSRLDHPGICTVYEAGEVEGTPFIAMRYVPGQSLATRLAERRRATASESRLRSSRTETDATLAMIEKVARALHAAHEAGLVHRDVKPGNIMVSDNNEPVLLDFGLAREAESTAASLTMTGDVIGTPAYMAPEQVSGHGAAVDRRSDIYSLGVTLFECLTLRLPFSAPTREGLYREILTGRAPDLRSQNGTMSRDLQVVLATAMAKDPHQRYATALDFAEDLHRVRHLQPIAARRPSLAGRAWRWARREPLKALLSAVLLALLAGTSGLVGYIASKRKATDVGEASILRRSFERALARAMAEIRLGDPDQARRHLEAADRIRPGDPLVLYGRVRLDIEGGDADRALARIAASPASPATKTRLRAHVLRTQGKVTDARKLLANLAPAESTGELVVEAHLNLLREQDLTYGNPTHVANAKEAYKLLLRAILKSSNAQLHHYVFLSEAAVLSRNGESCEDCAEALAVLFPDEPMAMDAVASCIAVRDPERGLEIARRTRRRWPDYTVACHTIAAIHLRLRQRDGAIAALRDLVGLEEGRRRQTLALLASIQVADGDLQGAEQTVREALQKWPDSAALLAQHGEILMRQRKLPESRRQFQRAMAASRHERPMILAAFGDLLQLMGKYEAAEKHLRRAIELGSGRDAWFTLGKALYKTHRYKEALEAFDKARNAMTTFVDAHLRHGETAVRLDKPEVAKGSYERALEIQAKAPGAHYMLGWIAQRQGDIDSAKEHYHAVDPQDPSYPQALCNLAMILAQGGNAAEALPLIRKGHELGSRREGWRYDSATWVKEVERLKRQQTGQR